MKGIQDLIVELAGGRTEVVTGKIVSPTAAKLYTGVNVKFSGTALERHIGKTAKFLKSGSVYILLQVIGESIDESKHFIV